MKPIYTAFIHSRR